MVATVRGFALCLAGMVFSSLGYTQGSSSSDFESVDVVNVAVFAGVGAYADDHHMDLTHGPVEAAKLREIYTLRGYQTVRALPVNGVLTKQAIVEAVRAAKAQVGNKLIGDFTFYFTGHGSFKMSTREAVILPGDASADCETNVFTAGELEALVTEVASTRHTIILDSCFSGAMARHLSLGQKPSEGEVITLSSTPKITGSAQMDGMIAIPLTTSGFIGRTGLPDSGERSIVYVCAAGANEPAMAVKNEARPGNSFSYFSRELRGVLEAGSGETGEVVLLGSINDIIKQVAKGLTSQIGNIFKPVTNGLAGAVRQFFPNAFKVPSKTRNREFWQGLIDTVTGTTNEAKGSDEAIDITLRKLFLNFVQGAGSDGTRKLVGDVFERELSKMDPQLASRVKGKFNELWEKFLPKFLDARTEGSASSKIDPATSELRVATKGLLGELFMMGRQDPSALSVQITKLGADGKEEPGVNVVGVRDRFAVDITCSASEGWLVLLNTDEKGDVALQWPVFALFDKDGVAKDVGELANLSANAFKVPAGGRLRILQNGFTSPGLERYEVVFFPKQVKVFDTLIGLLKLAKQGEANVTLTGIPNREPSISRAGISVQAVAAGE